MSSETLRFSNSGASSSWKIYSMGICGSSRPLSNLDTGPVIEEKQQMRHRTRSFMRVGAVALVLALAATISIAGQTQSAAPAGAPKAAPANAAAGKAYKAPRTPDGQPDLEGVWTNSTHVPLE